MNFNDLTFGVTGMKVIVSKWGIVHKRPNVSAKFRAWIAVATALFCWVNGGSKGESGLQPYPIFCHYNREPRDY